MHTKDRKRNASILLHVLNLDRKQNCSKLKHCCPNASAVFHVSFCRNRRFAGAEQIPVEQPCQLLISFQKHKGIMQLALLTHYYHSMFLCTLPSVKPLKAAAFSFLSQAGSAICCQDLCILAKLLEFWKAINWSVADVAWGPGPNWGPHIHKYLSGV